jgi:hypothetical protein
MSVSAFSRPLLRLAVLVASTLAAFAPAAAQQRNIALVIGNGAYAKANPLSNPVNDASDMAAALKEAGFDVILGLDLDKHGFDMKVRDFSRALPDADASVFFYAGHGLQVGGHNYLVPVDAELQNERDLDFEGVGLDFILKQMELGRETKTNIVFLDACRDNPLARNLARSMGTRSASVGSGLAQVQAGVGTFIAYSTQPGNVALDGQGRNSPFTAALARSIRQPDRNLTAVMVDVRRQVLSATNGRQVPWDHSALTGEFFFHQASAGGTAPKTIPVPDTALQSMQERVRQLEDELKSKTDQRQTVNLLKLEQVKERIRQMDEANRADQQQIFDTYSKDRRGGDASSRAALSMEVGTIQMRMVRRNQERAKLKAEMEKLEAETGTKGRHDRAREVGRRSFPQPELPGRPTPGPAPQHGGNTQFFGVTCVAKGSPDVVLPGGR